MSQRMTMRLLFAHLVFLFSGIVQAAAPDYYTVRDHVPQIQDATLNPFDTFSQLVKETLQKIDFLDLMEWEHHNEALLDPSEPYNRNYHYGRWVRDPRDNTCYNTRAKVLIRGSEIPVTFYANGCSVSKGRWYDPYTNRQYTDAQDLQIDHVVPLKNSYIMGGWKWDKAKRCLYANFLANDYHLLAVNGSENMQKSDHTPEEYIPPNAAYTCEYLAIWLKIKLIWNLALTSSEASAISQLVKQNQCDGSKLSIATIDLRKQRQSILDNMSLCRASH